MCVKQLLTARFRDVKQMHVDAGRAKTRYAFLDQILESDDPHDKPQQCPAFLFNGLDRCVFGVNGHEQPAAKTPCVFMG